MRKVLAAVVGIVALTVACVPLAQAQTAPAPIRAAFFYPWYPETWAAGHVFDPSRGEYDSSRRAVVDHQIADMQYAGMDAGIVSWWGPGSKTDARVPRLLNRAQGTGFRWALYYEHEGYADPSASEIDADLAGAQANYFGRAQYLHVDGKPVVFAYADGNDACGMIDRWQQASAGRWYVVLKVFGGYASCATQPDSWHQYAPAVASDRQGSYSYSVSPGFWKADESSPRLARDVARFQADAAAMFASNTQFQLVTTYNEWGEGTAVEPSTTWHRQYLNALHDAAAGVSPTPTPTGTPSPTITPSTTTTPPPPRDALVVIYMENKERSTVLSGSTYQNEFRARGIDFTHYYGVTHPSLPNYLALANGSTDGKSGTDSITAGELSQSPTVWNQLQSAGVSWGVYEEGMPSVCSSAVTSGRYALKHNPATPFASVFHDAATCSHVQPFSALDPAHLPAFSFVAPDLCNDEHDCSLATGDTWLRAHVEPMLAAGATVVITYDEGSSGTNGGGNIYAAVVGPGIAPRIDDATYNHYSLLRAVEDRFGLARLGGAGSASSLPLR